MSDEKVLVEGVDYIKCPCELKVTDGHLEADCETKEDQRLLAELLEKEVIIRVKPKVTIEQS